MCNLVATVPLKQSSGRRAVKKVRRSHNQAQAENEKVRLSQQGLTQNLVHTLHQILIVMSEGLSAVEKLGSLEMPIGNRLDSFLEPCEEFESLADRNYLPFLRRYRTKYWFRTNSVSHSTAIRC
jgi:hypothetical protein